MTQSIPSLYTIENAFQPAKEITDATRFAGRLDAVTTAYLGLMAVGANIAIIGTRGIGKTSLAQQVITLGRGDNDLLKKLNIRHDKRFDFLSMYHACGDSTSDTDDLLRSILTSKQCLGDWIYEIPKTQKFIHSLSPKLSAKIFGIGGEVGTQHSVEESAESIMTSHSLDTIFTNIVNDIITERLGVDGILMVIDEFDQIKDPSGFA